MNSRKRHGSKPTFLFLVFFLLTFAGGYALAQEPALKSHTLSLSADEGRGKEGVAVTRNGYAERWQAMRQGERSPARASLPRAPIKVPVTALDYGIQSPLASSACRNLIANPWLNIVELGDGTGTAEPWVFLEPITYFVDERDPDFGGLAFDGYSLLVADGDSGDPSPKIDIFGQGFLMPENLTDVTAEYWRLTLDGNVDDMVWGELWLLDNQGYLHLNDPDTYLVGWWDVFESEDQWALETITATDGIVQALSGQPAAIIFYNDTDGSDPGAPESQKEWMLFDDITLTACYKEQQVSGKRVYLPSVSKAGEVQPTCVPPSENPRDEFHSNRGYTQTEATCNSTLSNIDTADYYSYVPGEDGTHVLHLQKLPKDTEWSAMVFTDEDQPQFAPGEGDGDCRIIQPGAKDKRVSCELEKNKKYFIKVSAGSTPLAGPYQMKVVKP